MSKKFMLSMIGVIFLVQSTQGCGQNLPDWLPQDIKLPAYARDLERATTLILWAFEGIPLGLD